MRRLPPSTRKARANGLRADFPTVRPPVSSGTRFARKWKGRSIGFGPGEPTAPRVEIKLGNPVPKSVPSPRGGSASRVGVRSAVALSALFLSGFSGLLYEVCWLRQAALAFGSTTFASTTFAMGTVLGA